MVRPLKIHAAVTAPERAAAQDALARLRDGGSLCVDGGSSKLALPAFVAREVVTLLEAFAEGHTPFVSASDEEIGTQQAADFLKLSRPTVVKMMDDGRIPFRKPGKHRRVRVSDLMAFEAQLRRDREAALNELSALGQDAIRQARDNGAYSDDMT